MRTRGARAAVALVVTILIVQVIAFHGVRLDDAYITLRYAQNLASGVGFVFNRGDRLMGSTSPGEVLLSAVAYLFAGRDATPGVMAAVGCVGWTAQAVALFAILRRAAGDYRAAFVALTIAVGAAGSAQWVSLETDVACGAALTGVALALSSRWIAAACVCAFAALMRPDAWLVALPLAALGLRDLRWRAWKPALIAVGLGSIWPLFATLYFGSPIPQSAIAKVHQAGALAFARHIAVDLPNEVAIGATPLAVKVAFWGLALAGAALVVRADRRLAVLPAWGALHAAAYVALAPDPGFTWHLYPLATIAVALAAFTLATALARLGSSYALAAGAAAIAALAAGTVRFAVEYPHAPWFGARDRVYKEVAAWLAQNAAPGDVVDAEEVGTVGYYTDLRMNDHARLVTRYPGDVLWRFSHGKTTKLRWMILNGAQLEMGRERPFYEGRSMLPFTGDGWRIWVVDLHEPPRPSP